MILYHSRWFLTWILNQNVILLWPSWEANWLLCLPNWDCESIWCLYNQEMITPAKIRNLPMTRDLWPLTLKHGQAWWVQKKTQREENRMECWPLIRLVVWCSRETSSLPPMNMFPFSWILRPSDAKQISLNPVDTCFQGEVSFYRQ